MRFGKQNFKIWAVVLLTFALFAVLGYINFLISSKFDMAAFKLYNQHVINNFSTFENDNVSFKTFNRIIVIICGCVLFSYIDAQVRETRP